MLGKFCVPLIDGSGEGGLSIAFLGVTIPPKYIPT